MRFVHTADWQLGKPFGRFDADVRSALTEARFDAVDAIGRAAMEHGAAHVLVAGDVFDTEGPEDRTIVQALSRMERHACRWWLLPGNHDFARNSGLWDRVRARAGERIAVMSAVEPREVEPGVWLLPAPLIHRHNLEDPTAGFDREPTPGAKLRIGLAHGSVQGFGSRGETPNHIPPDRAQTSNLDYLALGDWHGALSVNARTCYCGTPEPDSFARDAAGAVLLVDLEPGEAPTVRSLPTGRFRWLARTWTTNDLAAFEAEWASVLTQVEPAATLLQLTLRGAPSFSDRLAILGRLENDVRHRLRSLEVRADELVAKPSPEDLSSLNVEGMLGTAAVRLSALSESGGTDAQVARRALERLFIEHQRGRPA